MTENKKANEAIANAFERLDFDMLKKAIDDGGDINSCDIEDILFCINNDRERTPYNLPWDEKKARIMKMLTLAKDSGFELDKNKSEGNDYYYQIEPLLKYSCNEDISFAKWLIDLGFNLNVPSLCGNLIQTMEGHAFMELYCGRPNASEWYYNVSRLLVFKGAKPDYILNPKTNEDKFAINAGRMYLQSLASSTKEEILKYRLDEKVVKNAKFFYPENYYDRRRLDDFSPDDSGYGILVPWYDIECLMMDCLDVFSMIVGKDQLSDKLLGYCIYEQYPHVFRFLTDIGLKPNASTYEMYNDFGHCIPYRRRKLFEEDLFKERPKNTSEAQKQKKSVVKPKPFNAEEHTKLINILADAWRNLDATELLKYIHPGFQYDSQWVFESMFADRYPEYITGKFETIKKTGSKIKVEIVEDTYYPGEMIGLNQDDKSKSFLRIKCTDGLIYKMDMCMF